MVQVLEWALRASEVAMQETKAAEQEATLLAAELERLEGQVAELQEVFFMQPL